MSGSVVPVEIVGWLACAAFLVMLYNQLAKARSNVLGDSKKVGPQPFVIEKAMEYATRDQLDKGVQTVQRRVDENAEQISKLWGALREDKAAAEANASRRSAGIYSKIDEVDKRMSKGFQDVERAIGRLEGVLSKGERSGATGE